MNITREDIELLVREPSAAMRSRIAQKISVGYGSGAYTANEVTLANEIFRLLLKDTEVRVRKLLADELKHCMHVPHDIAWKLANDHADVAVPMLQHSFVLSEEDLIQIVQATREHTKLSAIAQRASISRDLSQALVETKDARVVRHLLGNKGAAIGDATMGLVFDQFNRDQSILEQMVYRGGLAPEYAEKLFSKVSDALRKQLTKKYRLSRHIIEDVTKNARETATLQFISPWMSQQDINRLISQMHTNKRLTDSVIIRSLCIGDLRFFETAIAKRVGIPPSNARLLLLDPGPLGFKALYESAHLPESFYEAVSLMLRFALEETAYGTYRKTDFAHRMSEHIMKGGYQQSVPNMDVMLIMIGRAFHERPTLH